MNSANETIHNRYQLQPRTIKRIALAGGVAAALALGTGAALNRDNDSKDPTTQTTSPEPSVIDDGDMVIPRPNNSEDETSTTSQGEIRIIDDSDMLLKP